MYGNDSPIMFFYDTSANSSNKLEDAAVEIEKENRFVFKYETRWLLNYSRTYVQLPFKPLLLYLKLL